MNLPIVKILTATHRDKEVLQLHFQKNESVLSKLRSNRQLRWSQTMNCWYMPYQKDVLSQLFHQLKGAAFIDYEALKESNKEKEVTSKAKPLANALLPLPEEIQTKVQAFVNWMRSKRYSESTIGTYSEALKTFLRFYADKDIGHITNGDLIKFNNEYILKNKLSASFQNQIVNAIKLFFRTIELKSMETELIHRPKRAHRLPNVLSKEEVKAILNAHGNLKHKAMLSLIYSCGLRRSELLNLKLNDIDKKRGLIIVKQAKGKKDRIVPLGEKLLVLLDSYLESYKPKEWLFEGQPADTAYDESSLAAVLKQAVQKCKINKAVTLHWLRHSYATHLLEGGTDLRYIQELLGHSRSTTTEIYTHVSTKSLQKVISPFDTL
jgi:integrase/recombinase XerD